MVKFALIKSTGQIALVLERKWNLVAPKVKVLTRKGAKAYSYWLYEADLTFLTPKELLALNLENVKPTKTKQLYLKALIARLQLEELTLEQRQLLHEEISKTKKAIELEIALAPKKVEAPLLGKNGSYLQ